ncbi:MAG: hypothetical protein Q7R41_14450 [Phycisphaerales bacterium]|nr:hypothetical protein [Phycisphaerales bacterium]
MGLAPRVLAAPCTLLPCLTRLAQAQSHPYLLQGITGRGWTFFFPGLLQGQHVVRVLEHFLNSLELLERQNDKLSLPVFLENLGMKIDHHFFPLPPIGFTPVTHVADDDRRTLQVEQNAEVTHTQPKTRIPVEALHAAYQVVPHRFRFGQYALSHLFGQLLEVAKCGCGELQIEMHLFTLIS